MAADTLNEIAELFNLNFTSVFSEIVSDDVSTKSVQSTVFGPRLDDFHFTFQDVRTALKALNINKATGADEIPARLLKKTAEQIAPSLAQLFNISVHQGDLPGEWKLANIIPVYKMGDKAQVENYRPISLLSIVSKVLERCILVQIRDHLKGLISHVQHGFTTGRSCVTQLIEVLDCIGSQLDSGKQTDVIYLDMSKAFDTVSHSILASKRRQFNIIGNALNWFKAYLHCRQMRVTVLGATSSQRPVTSGVPQGSRFFLYVNDLPDVVMSSRVASFADDTKLYHCIDYPTDAESLQEDLHSLERWSEVSGLVFNGKEV